MPKPFYSNQTIEQQLDLIHHMLQFGDELLLVSGENGVGKSTQLQELIRRLGEGWEICFLAGSESPQIAQLFERVSQSFGYDYSTIPSAELLDGFQRHLEQREAGKTYALLIDDADRLEESTLEAVTHLSQLQNSNGRLLRVALFGNEGLRERAILKGTPSREVIIAPLNSEQIQEYIDFCIQQGRYSFGQPPSAALRQQIENRSGGLPEQIEATLQQPSQATARLKQMLDWRVAAAMLLLLAIVAGFLLNSGDPEPTQSPITEKPGHLQQPVIRKREAVLTPPDEPEGGSDKLSAEDDQGTPEVLTERESEARLISELLKQSEPQLVDPVPSAETEMMQSDGAEGMAEGAVASQKAIAVEAPLQEITEQLQGSQESASPGISPVAVAGPDEQLPAATTGRDDGRAFLLGQPVTSFTIQLLAAEREKSLDELIAREGLRDNLARFSFVRNGRVIHVLTYGVYRERVEAEATLKEFSSSVKPWLRPIGDIHQLFRENPPPNIEHLAPVLESGGARDTAWLWSQNPALITIQLVAGGNREMLEPYINQSLLLGDTAIFESSRESKPWFVLLHGRYQTREEAHHAINALPQMLQAEKPWVRSFASVHDELSRTN